MIRIPLSLEHRIVYSKIVPNRVVRIFLTMTIFIHNSGAKVNVVDILFSIISDFVDNKLIYDNFNLANFNNDASSPHLDFFLNYIELLDELFDTFELSLFS